MSEFISYSVEPQNRSITIRIDGEGVSFSVEMEKLEARDFAAAIYDALRELRQHEDRAFQPRVNRWTRSHRVKPSAAPGGG